MLCAITSEIEEAKDVLSGSQDLNGTLRIGTIESICSSILPDILSRYHALHPAVEISIITDSPEALLDMMNKSCVDLVYFMDKRMYDPKWDQDLRRTGKYHFRCKSGSSLHKKKSSDIK